MKLLLITTGLTAILGVVVNSYSIKLLPPSDFEVGTLGPDDELLDSSSSEYTPDPDNTIVDYTIGVYTENSNFSYITAQELGYYPDARASLIGGGPGTTFFRIKIVPGPLGGWNYSIKAYGQQWDGSSKKAFKRINIYNYA